MSEPLDFPVLRFPEGLDVSGFLTRYWQRRPLLMRQALPGFENPLPADELAGVACEPDVEARIVLERAGEGLEKAFWEVRYGPFDAAQFASLPPSHWTLLVQDVDKHIPEIGALLERFDFVPRWRIDDIMVSYAEDQGSVGPHVDDYDVFLIQAEGCRRWRITTDPDAPRALVPGLELRILQQFEADQEWLLRPGDVLYLPPGVPHWGIAEGPCQTWSVGLRSPHWRELADDWLAQVAEWLTPKGRWRDQRHSPPADPAELDAETLLAMRAGVEAGVASASAADFQAWLGAWLTEPKLNLELVPVEPPWSVAELLAFIEAQRGVERDGRSQILFAAPQAEGEPAMLFANGICHRLTGELLPLLSILANRRTLGLETLRPWLGRAEVARLLTDLFNAGHFRRCDGPGGEGA